MSDVEWMANAACRGVISEMWDDSTPTADALRFCFRCPVIRECASYGLSRPYGSDAGVLGGMGVYDRQRVRAGKASVPSMWQVRLRDLVNADWESALDGQFARSILRPADG
jgi:hypothetical protein